MVRTRLVRRAPLDPRLAHQTADLIAADVVTSPLSGLPQLPRPLDPVLACHNSTSTPVMTTSRRSRTDAGLDLAA